MPGEISSLKIFLRDVRQYYFRAGKITAILVYSCLLLFSNVLVLNILEGKLWVNLLVVKDTVIIVA